MSEAITREEQLLNAIATGEPVSFRPVTREEKFLAKAGGQEVVVPDPITRREILLNKIAENGGGGAPSEDQYKMAVALIERTPESGNWAPEMCEQITTVGMAACMMNLTLTSLTLPNVQSVQQMGFTACMMLQEFNAPKLVSVGDQAFMQTGLLSVDLPSCKTIGDNAFSQSMVQSVSLAELEEFEGQFAFEKTQLQEINMPKLKRLEVGTFDQTPIVEFINNSVETMNGFRNCPNLNTVIVPNATVFGNQCFDGCSSLEKVDVSAKTKIYPNVFSGCSGINALILRYDGDGICTASASWASAWGSPTDAAFLIDGKEAYIYVPSSKIVEYQSDSVWGHTADRFRAIEDYPEICG